MQADMQQREDSHQQALLDAKRTVDSKDHEIWELRQACDSLRHEKESQAHEIEATQQSLRSREEVVCGS